jgi:hypothetical protein
MRLPGQVMRDRFRRGMIMPFVSATDESTTTLTASGMARRLCTEVKKSWALAYVHIAYINKHLHSLFEQALDDETKHELACAGTINLLAYLGWLRSQETFASERDSVTLIPPIDGPTRGLNPNIGAIELRLLNSTKTYCTEMADSIIAWATLSGLELGTWMSHLLAFSSAIPNRLFSTTTTPIWTSNNFRTNFAYPILELQRISGEPTLKKLSPINPASGSWARSIPCIPGDGPVALEYPAVPATTSPIPAKAPEWPPRRRCTSTGVGK